jgi:hypothetical protein
MAGTGLVLQKRAAVRQPAKYGRFADAFLWHR